MKYSKHTLITSLPNQDAGNEKFDQLNRKNSMTSELQQKEKLENLIDLPIKRCIALLNLMGFETGWSCCGFSYPGDGGKSHELGRLYIQFLGIGRHRNETSKVDAESIDAKLYYLFHRFASESPVENKQRSAIALSMYGTREGRVSFQISYDIPKQCENWDPNSKHYFELPLSAILRIETFLLYFGNLYGLFTAPTVTVKDLYKEMAESNELYHYIVTQNNMIGEPWIVKRDDYLILTTDGDYKFKPMNLEDHVKV